jgi:hypothetical protein
MMKRGFAVGWFCALALALTAGCAGYHLGPTNGMAAGSRSIQFTPFVNRTLEPRLGEYAMMSLRKNFMQDGTYRVDTHDEGDIIVTGDIQKYERTGLSFQPTDVLTVQDYNIYMTVKVVAKERSTGKVILEKIVTGRTALRAGPDLTSAERQAIPLLTDDFAKRTLAALADGTW